jgi:hypothetical protein
VDLLHRAVPVIVTPQGVRALERGKPSNPVTIAKYLAGKFGPHLEAAEHAMADLALDYSPDELAAVGYALYEKFRPDIPAGVKGWGARGILDVDSVRKAAARDG